MARQKKQLSNAFEQFEGKDTTKTKDRNEVEVEVVKDAPEKHTDSHRTVSDIKADLMSKYEEKSQKPTVEDTHTRSTFLFDNELRDRLDRLAQGKRGFKTMFINRAVEALLDEYEND